MCELLALLLCVSGSLLLLRDVDRDAEYSRRLAIDDGRWTAAARRNPAHRAVAQDHAKLGLVMAAVRQHALDCGVAHGKIVGMHAAGERGVIDGRVRRTPEDPLVLNPDLVVR